MEGAKRKEFLDEIHDWSEAGENERIVDSILQLPADERDDGIEGQLAAAYNKLGEFGRSLSVLEKIRPTMQKDFRWQYGYGYAKFYSALEASAFGKSEIADSLLDARSHIARSIELGADHDYADNANYFLCAIDANLSKPGASANDGRHLTMTLELNMRLLPENSEPFKFAVLSKLPEELAIILGKTKTFYALNGEPMHSTLDFLVDQKLATQSAVTLAGIVNELGCAKGSRITVADQIILVGTLEGMAFYVNGTDLDEKVYRHCNTRYIAKTMNTLIGYVGQYAGHWDGPTETALYFYGSSFFDMKRRISQFIDEYPLCNKSRIEKITA